MQIFQGKDSRVMLGNIAQDFSTKEERKRGGGSCLRGAGGVTELLFVG